MLIISAKNSPGRYFNVTPVLPNYEASVTGMLREKYIPLLKPNMTID
jgi:hypothetical protein